MFQLHMTINGAILRVRSYSSDMKAISEMRDEFVGVLRGGGKEVEMEVRDVHGNVLSRMECEGDNVWFNRGL